MIFSLTNKYGLLLLFGFLSSTLVGQKNPRLTVVAEADDRFVRLRWLVDRPEDWLQANAQGYRITRETLSSNGQDLTAEQINASRRVFHTTLRPLGANDWPDDDLYQAAKEIIYNPDWETSPTNTPLSTAAQEQEGAENRLFFAQLLADRDFRMSRDMALGFLDRWATAGNLYRYLVEINGFTNEEGLVFATAEAMIGGDLETLFQAEQLSGQDGDGNILIGWSLDDVENQYTSYDIFRSPAQSTQWAQVNTVPFVYISEPGDRSNYAYFTDHPDQYGEYKYYVRGRTPFQRLGPPSETVTAISRPDPMDLLLRIDSVVTTTDGLSVHWPSIPTNTTHAIESQRIYKADKATGQFREIATLMPAARLWSDPSPTATGYYVVELEDTYGHRYRTAPIFGQLQDQSPPVTPSGFTGIDRGNGVVDLTWENNQEADLEGYRIFRAFTRNAEFVQVQLNTVHWNGYTDDLRENIFNDSIYYKLQAEDFHGNASAKTQVLAIARADMRPPNAPLLLAALATPSGVGFSWRYSQSSDVARHELRRRAHGSRDWVTVVTITPEDEDGYVRPLFDESGTMNFVDHSDLGRGRYDYRLLAYDHSGNIASSELLTVRPHDSGIRGSITRLQADFTCQDSSIVTPLSETLGYSMEQLITFYETEDYLTPARRRNILLALELNGLLTSEDFPEWNALSDEAFYTRIDLLAEEYLPRLSFTDCEIGLTWDYDVQPGLLHFQVLRSRRGSRLRPYKVLPLSGFTDAAPGTTGPRRFQFIDQDAETGIRYVYSVVGVYSDGGYTGNGGAVMVVVQ